MSRREELEVYPLWQVDLTPGAPRVSLGVPASLAQRMVYEHSELLACTGFGHVAHRTDVENGSEFLLFMATHGDDRGLDELAALFECLVKALGVLASIDTVNGALAMVVLGLFGLLA